MTVFQLVLICEVIMYYVNKRPIGMSSTLESVRPADILPVWSKVNPSVSMTGCTKVVESAKQEFLERWNQLYKLSILKQGFTSNHNLDVGDIVLVTDLLTKLNYPQIGRVTKVDTDHAGFERYFTVEYKKNKKSFSVVKRPAQSLCVVMKKN